MSPTSLLRGIGLLLFLQWISTLIISALQIPFPPALLGMLFLVALLATKIVPVQSVEGICNILISKMGMLFLPAGISVMLYADVIMAEFKAISITIVVCSAAVLLTTAMLLQLMLKKPEAK